VTAPQPTPRCSVVVPTRNRRDLLCRVLDAVLAQERVDVDVVVVDEGSDDGTGAAVAARADTRVRVVRHDVAQGLPAARNAGLARASADWVAFCDDDDLWAPTKLARQLDALERTGASWSCTGAVEVDPELRVVGWERVPHGVVDPAELRQRNVVPGGGSGVVARTELVGRLGGFDTSLRAAEDWEMWLRLCEAGPPAVVDEPLLAYRVWPASMSRDLGRMDDAIRRLGELHGVQPDRDHARYRIKQMLRNGHRGAAASALVRLGLDRRIGERTDILKAPAAALFPSWYLRAGLDRATRYVPEGWPDLVAAWLPALEREPAGAEAA
jgi:glycosyltransferase involved in cell wall biosynthesis